jgi:hypothetical protein
MKKIMLVTLMLIGVNCFAEVCRTHCVDGGPGFGQTCETKCTDW